MADRKAIVRFEEQGAAKVRDALDRTADDAEKASARSARAAEKIGQALGAALAAGATSAALLIRSAINTADALDDMSVRTGISVEDLSRLQVQAKLTDTDLGTLQKTVGRLSTQQLEFARGNKDVISLFKALGVDAVDTNGNLRDSVDVLRDVADVFSVLPDGPAKTSLAIKLLGKDAQELLPFLSQSGEEIDRLNRLADELGITISGDTAAAASEFNENLDLLGLGVSGLAMQVAEDLLPDLIALVKEFRELITEAGGVEAVAEDVGDGIRLMGNLAQGAVDGVQALTFAAIGLFKTLDGLSRLGPPGWIRSLADGGSAGDSFRDAGVAFDLAALSGQETRDWLFDSAPTPLPGQGTGRRGGAARMAKSEAASRDADRRAAEARIKAYQEEAEAEKAAKEKAAAARRAAAADARAQAAAERELKRIMEEQRAAAADFQTSLEDLRAELGGPVAQAYLDYERQVKVLSELHEKGKVSQEDLTEALALAKEARDKEVAAIEARLTPAEQVLASLREEIELLGMSGLAREKYLARQAMGPDATEEELAESDQLIDQRDALYEVRDAMDAVREAGAGFLEDWLSGAKSFEDAALGALDQLNQRLLQMAAEKLIEQILGSFGSTDSGASGGFGAFMSAIFGGGSAKGNVFSAGARVEAFAAGAVVSGPTLFPMAGGRVGLMGEAGEEGILPLRRGRDGRLGVEMHGGAPVRQGDTYYISVPSGTERRQAQRVGQAVATEQQRTQLRNR